MTLAIILGLVGYLLIYSGIKKVNPVDELQRVFTPTEDAKGKAKSGNRR